MTVQLRIDWNKPLALEDAIDHILTEPTLYPEPNDAYESFRFEPNSRYVTRRGMKVDSICSTRGLVQLGNVELPLFNKPCAVYAATDGYAVGLLLRVYPSTYRFSSLPNLELRDYAKIEAGWYPVRWISFR